MHVILSVSYNPQLGDRQQLLLKDNGYAVFPSANAPGAMALIQSYEFDAVLLGSAMPVRERISIGSLALARNIPVVCMCETPMDGECQAVHVPSSQPDKLLAALKRVLSTRRTCGEIGVSEAS